MNALMAAPMYYFMDKYKPQYRPFHPSMHLTAPHTLGSKVFTPCPWPGLVVPPRYTVTPSIEGRYTPGQGIYPPFKVGSPLARVSSTPRYTAMLMDQRQVHPMAMGHIPHPR